eukprot:828341_1
MSQYQFRDILKLCTWIITLPIYIYALIKWHQFNGHFLIRNRFPKISYLLFYIMFIAQSLSVIQGWLQIFDIPNHIVNYHITYIVLSLTYTISGLVLYRINLIYLKWKSLQPITAITTAKILNQRNSVKNISDAPRA